MIARHNVTKPVDVSSARTIDAILSASGTDWEPMLAPISAELPSGIMTRPEHFRAIVRPDTGDVLGIVGTKYRTNSHREQLSQLQPLLDSGFLQPASVSVWDGGERMAFQFRVPELDHSVGHGDTVSPLFTLAFGLDGQFSDRAFLARFRWFCSNQMGLVRKSEGGNVGIRHMGQNEARYADLVQRHILSLGGQVAQDTATMRRMMSKAIKGKELLAFFAESMGAESPAAVVDELYGNAQDPSANRGIARNIVDVVADYRADDGGAPGSLWHAFNGLTRYVTHTEGRNASVRSARALLGSPVTERAWTIAERLAA